MKNDELTYQYLKEEAENLVKKKETYTMEEIDQVLHDYRHVIEQRNQLEEAKKNGTITKDDADLANLLLMIIQYAIQDVADDVRRYVQEKMEENEEKIRLLKEKITPLFTYRKVPDFNSPSKIDNQIVS